MTAKCTVRLLAMASQAAYRIKKDNLIDPSYSQEYSDTLTDIAMHGYAITDSIAPKKSEGTGTTPLAAVCLSPSDGEGPIVISFRGTKTSDDVRSDIRLGAMGVVSKSLRDDAFEFYQKVRRENPGREIVLTGHSLGGHLAQYVGAKAYNTDPDLLSKSLLQVRTFNTAPVDTAHSAVFQRKRGIESHFVNYRLSPDVVSDLPLNQYYGNTFVFPSEKGRFASHPMNSIMRYVPGEILNQTVGTSEFSKRHNMLVELVNGAMSSYQCRVEGQMFSRFRAGSKNCAEMQKEFPIAIEHLKKGEYDKAIVILDGLKNRLDGAVSINIVNVLIQGTKKVMLEEQMHQSEKPQHNAQAKQEDMKSRLHQFYDEERVLTEEVEKTTDYGVRP